MATWDKERASAATAHAEKAIREALEEMTPEERKGAEKLLELHELWFNGRSGEHATGHKALGRIYVKLYNELKTSA